MRGGRDETEGQESELDEFLIQSRPRACLGAFARVRRPAAGCPERALPLRLGRRAACVEPGNRCSRASGGSASLKERGERSFRPRRSAAARRRRRWRDDRLVVVVYEEGLSGEAGRRFARGLAEKQRQRIAALEPGGGGRPRDRTGRSGDRDSRLLARARVRCARASAGSSTAATTSAAAGPGTRSRSTTRATPAASRSISGSRRHERLSARGSGSSRVPGSRPGPESAAAGSAIGSRRCITTTSSSQ